MDKKDDANLKIADFGFAKKHDAGSELLRTQCGTPGCKMRVVRRTGLLCACAADGQSTKLHKAGDKRASFLLWRCFVAAPCSFRRVM